MTAERPLLSISRKTLDEGPKEIHSALPAEWLTRKLSAAEAARDPRRTAPAADLSSKSEGRADLRVSPAGGDNFLVQGHVRAAIETTCGRCLGPATVPVDAELTLLLVPEVHARAPKGKHAKESEGEFEFDPDEADVATYDGETVVLDDLVREALLLELPISALCSEECAGMASDPAAAETLAAGRVDPRLAPLAALRDKLATSPATSPGGGAKSEDSRAPKPKK